jgi:hypothetical protein
MQSSGSLTAVCNFFSKEIDMNKEHPTPSLLRLPSTGNFILSLVILGLLIGVLLLMGYAALPAAESQKPTQGAPKPAAAGGPAVGYVMDAARVRPPAEENLFQTYTAWLAAAHAHAALDGQDAPLPDQF